ncbi:MAG: hypothetical protein ACI4RM_07130 [Ruminococcus sp.]
MKNTFKVALCGVISAFALVLMLLTGIIWGGTYAFPCFAGMLLTVVVIEFSPKWAYCVYGAVSLLSLILAGDKEAVVYFILFFGFYPILKSTVERSNSKVFQYIFKYLIFNISMICAFLVGKFILMIPDEEFTFFGVYLPWVFLAVGNIFFLFYDRCVTVFISLYIYKIRNKIFKI